MTETRGAAPSGTHGTMPPARAVDARAAAIRLAVFDVDGVMTDGRLYLDADGGETKTMHVRDGLGLKRLQAAGVAVAAGAACLLVA